MSTWALLAPGPSASADQAERVRGLRLGVVGCAYQLAPWADFIASTDAAWWRKYPEAKNLPGLKFSMHHVAGVTKVAIPGLGVCNSGVLALECAKRQGAERILLFGFDMHGSHFFGRYENGLSNTTDAKRAVHFRQYEAWRKANPQIEVINCTAGSALRCFPMVRADEIDCLLAVERERLSA